MLMTVLKKEIHQAWCATCNLVALLTQRDLFTRAHQAEKGISSCKFPAEGKSAEAKTQPCVSSLKSSEILRIMGMEMPFLKEKSN